MAPRELIAPSAGAVVGSMTARLLELQECQAGTYAADSPTCLA